VKGFDAAVEYLENWKKISLTGISAEESHEAYQEIIVAVTKQECIENQNWYLGEGTAC
jgi:hypothetical protein